MRLVEGVDDVRSWVLESSGTFSCKSFFRSFFPHPASFCFPFLKLIWKTLIPSKVQFFSWLLVIGKLPTCDIVQRRHTYICISPNWCVLCKSCSEDQDHLFLHCPFSTTLWNRVLNELGLSWTKPWSLVDLFSLNLGSYISKRGKVFWRVIVQAFCWSLWLERNRRILENREETLEEEWARIKFRVAWWVSNHKEFKSFFCFRFS